jgi:hypothetical protein
MRFIHFTNAENLKAILSKGILPGAYFNEDWDAFGDKTPRVFCDVLFEDEKARYNGCALAFLDIDPIFKSGGEIAGIIFELSSDDLIYIGPWGFPLDDMTKISVDNFNKLLSSALHKIQSKWIDPINAYDFLLGELWDYRDIVGRVIRYFPNWGIAILDLEDELKIGDKVKIAGKTTEMFSQNIDSIQKNNQPIKIALKGDKIGIKVTERVRKNDTVFKDIGDLVKDIGDWFISCGFEVQVTHPIHPDQIIGYRLFESEEMLHEAWYKEDMFG